METKDKRVRQGGRIDTTRSGRTDAATHNELYRKGIEDESIVFLFAKIAK